MHFAALSLVGESMRDPGKYWRAMSAASLNPDRGGAGGGVRNFVFSSTCATYGDQDGVVLNENTPQHPINAYGAIKLAIEQMLKDFGASRGLRPRDLSLFQRRRRRPRGRGGRTAPARNPSDPADAGCGRGQAAGADGVWHRLPDADGTCMRDYVHVMDLVDAHVLGLKWLRDGKGPQTFCLGTGSGFSVREVIDQFAPDHQPRCARHRGRPPCRRCGQAGLRIRPRRPRTGLAADPVNNGRHDRRRLALASGRSV
jgi:UDP-glucose 4-epimerase